MPALPSSMSVLMIRRLTGWPTSCSLSPVVYPQPVKALLAWNRASGRLSPVRISITVATRTVSSDSVRTTSSVAMAVMGQKELGARSQELGARV